MAKLASLIPSVGNALGIFVVNNITVPYIEPFPKPLKGTPYESMAIINSMLTEKFCCRSLAPVVRRQETYMKKSLIITGIVLTLISCNGCSKKTSNPVEPNNSIGWTEVNNGLPANSGVSTLLASGTNLFAGVGSEVFISTNNGTNWTPINTGLPLNNGVVSLAVSGANLFVSIQYNAVYDTGGVFVSTNNGASWTVADSGLNTIVDAFLVSGTNLFAGGVRGVFLSTNSGKSWNTINSGLPREPFVAAFASSGNNLFVGTQNGIFLSTNNGTNWTAVNTALTWQNYATTLSVSGTNIFAGTCQGKVYISTNNGTTWTAVDSGLTDIWVNAMLVSGMNIFLGSEGYIFQTNNNGISWNAIDSGFFQVSSFAVLRSDLFVGYGNIGGNKNGVWKRPLN
jgi:photosystem II stability/assembly factor-like uncharacterized protein